MYNQLASRLFLDTNTTKEWSEAVSLEGFNAFRVEATCINAPSGGVDTLTISVEESNDRENWTAVAGFTGPSFTAPGYDTKKSSGDVAARWVRLKFSSAGSPWVVAAGIHLSVLGS